MKTTRAKQLIGLIITLGLLINSIALPVLASSQSLPSDAADKASQRSKLTPSPAAPDSIQQTKARANEAYGKLPISFEANRGQTDSSVKFLARGAGYSLFLTAREAVMVLSANASGKTQGRRKVAPKASVLRMKFVGARPAPEVTGVDQLAGHSNYLVGKDPRQWHTDVPNYAQVQYREIYQGVDLVFHGNQRQLEYDFHVAPGANPENIKLSFAGARRVRVDAASGDLILRTATGDVRQHKPVTYQEIGGERRAVASSFRVNRRGEVGFEVGKYDTTKPLVIDPTLSYSTYLGGSDDDRPSHIAVDTGGNAYVMGYTASANFPTTPGAFDPTYNGGNVFLRSDYFVTKLNPTGTALVYSTYLGGSGDESIVGGGIAVDASGNAYVTGGTESEDFPVTPGVFQPAKNVPGPNSNAFVTKLNPAGSALVYSTYLGGGNEVAYGIAVDSMDNACVTGTTGSDFFPVTPTAFQSTRAASPNPLHLDAFVTKLNATGTALLYSSYLGGNGDENFNYSGIAVDPADKIYLGGKTATAGQPVNTFPTTPGAFQTVYGGGTADAFAAKFDPTLSGAASLVYSTFLGGNSLDGGQGIDVDSGGNAYVGAFSFSVNYPTTPGAFDTTYAGGGDIVVTKLNPAGSALVYSTYLGGTGNEATFGIALDPDDHAWVTAPSSSPNYPVTPDAYQPTLAGPDYDVVVTELSADGASLEYSTYLGGAFIDYGIGITTDSAGSAYVTGFTNSLNFPTTPGAYQPIGGGVGFNGFVAKFGEAATACPNDPDNDVDGDGVCGDVDNCPTTANPDQADADADGIGDACDACPNDATNDADGDGICGGVDNCPTTANPNQEDADGDGIGDACDACPADPANDADGDGVCGNVDNCPTTANPDQADADGDAIGDACDACPLDAANDADGDGVCGNVDNCPTVSNPDQRDTDGDGVGDACTPFEFPQGGQFVIGDLANMSGGATVNFWGSQWSQHNPMSGGSAPNSFKGFENGNAVPTCGSTWTSQPGNSSNPPLTVPQYMAVIVSSNISKNGSVISGDVKRIIVVRTNPGYGPSPGHWGTGQVVAILCSAP